MKRAETPGNQAPKIARAVVYVRVSTDDQADHGAGLDAQRDACYLAADRLGLIIVGPFGDEGISGAAPLDRREALGLAIGEVGKGDVLLVAKRDRLGRDPVLVAMIEGAIKGKGGRVVSAAGEGTDDDSPTSILLRRIVDAFAEFERLMIKGRTKAGLAALRRRGRLAGSIPFGSAVVDDGVYSKTSIKAKEFRPSKIVEDPAEQETIRRMELLAASGLGPRGIARALTAEGRLPKSGRSWHPSSVAKILARAGSTNSGAFA